MARTPTVKRRKVERPYHARLVVHGIADLDKRQVRRIVEWLRMQADDLSLSPREYSNEYTARLMK